MRRLWLVAAVPVLGLLASGARAQDAAPSYPSKSVELVVPFSAGGGLDVVARMIGSDLSQRWHQSVVIENRPGAGGTIGAAVVARSAPDGQTLLVTPVGAMVLAPFAFDEMGYKLSDLTAVATIVSLPQLLMVPASSPFKTLADLLAYAKANPGKINVGSSGKGTGQQMAVELLTNMAHISLTDVPYRGSGQANTAIMGGEIDLLMSDPSALPYVQSGRLRALGVSTRERMPALPDVPAIGEVVAGYEAASYYGLFAPTATPRAVQDKINAGVAAALKQPGIASKLTDSGMFPVFTTPGQSQAFVQGEAKKWSDLIQAAGIKLK